MLHFTSSGLSLHCLPMSHKKDVRLIWVNSLLASDDCYHLLISFAYNLDLKRETEDN